LLRRYINVPRIAAPISIAAWLLGSETAIDSCLPSRFLKKERIVLEQSRTMRHADWQLSNPFFFLSLMPRFFFLLSRA